MLLLRNKDVSSILQNLSPDQTLHFLHTFSRTLREFSVPSSDKRLIHQPVRIGISTSLGHTTLFMPSSNTENTGIKIVSIPAEGGGLPSTLNMFTPDGRLTGVLNAAEITGYRTALASMVIFVNRKWEGKGEIVIFGAGKQAEWHLRLALSLCRQDISKISVVNRSSSTLDDLDRNVFSQLRSKYPNTSFHTVAKAANADYELQIESLVSKAVAIFCCTPSSEPLFPYSYLKNAKLQNRYISIIGSYKPNMQEIDSDTVRSAELLVVDTKEACLEESGELINAKVTEDELIEIGELISEETGQLTDAEDTQLSILSSGNVVFKCVGMGIMDVLIGKLLLDKAKDQHLGLNIDDF